MTITVEHARLSAQPYIVAGFLPRPMPMAPALTKSAVSINSVGVGGELADQLSLNLGATARWIVDPHKIKSIESGMIRWYPSQGSLLNSRWAFTARTMALQDPAYSYPDAHGVETSFPALIFNGGMWASLVAFTDHLASFTVSIVLRLRRNPGAYADIFASKYTAADGDPSADIAVQYRAPWGGIRTIKRGYTKFDPITLTGRPLILVAKSDAHRTYTIIGDNNWSAAGYRHDAVSTYDMTWYLGRAADNYYNSLTLHADILDIGLWDHALTDAQVRSTAHKLNQLYRIVK